MSTFQLIDNSSCMIDNDLSVWKALRGVSSVDFCELMLTNSAGLPTDIVPNLPDDKVQKMYNGRCNLELLPSCVSFVNGCSYLFNKYSLPSVDEIKILDYGCGWGRLLRLMRFFASPENIYGVDPLQSSIDICRSCGINSNLSICEEIPRPRSLNFPGNFFNYIYSWSVFTHLSYTAMDSIQKMLLHYIHPKGILMITIRPLIFWDYYRKIGRISSEEYDFLTLQHQSTGFAYRPLKHGWAAVNNEVHFGDTTITLDFLKSQWINWSVLETFIMPEEPMQQCVVLAPSNK